MPVLSTEVCEVPEKPYQMDIGGVDSLKPDDALVPYAPACAKAAFWGGTLPAAGTVQAALTRADAGYFSAEELKRGILLRQVHATPGALCTTSQCCSKQDR
jgi:hypothetical protein